MRDLTKTRKAPEFLKLQKNLKALEGKKAEEIILRKVSVYQELTAHIESE